MAQTLYREWFVKFRFPGHQKVKMVDSPLGKIPEGWEVRSLADLADVNALTVKRDEEPKEISYVDIASVSTGSIDKVQKMRFDKAPSREQGGSCGMETSSGQLCARIENHTA
jgi:type I restriction enzyme S subunit